MSRASGYVRVIARVMSGLTLQSEFELRLGLRLLIGSVAMVLGGNS